MKICPDLHSALASLKSNSVVFIHRGAATPTHLINGLVAEAERLKNVELIHLHTEGPVPYADERFAESFKITNLFVGKNLRGHIDYERIDYLPCLLSEIPRLFRTGAKILDMALVHVSPPDRHGFVSLGVSVDIAKAAVESAKVVVAQINPRMPKVHGDGFIHIDDIDFVIEHEAALYTSVKRELSDVDMRIGRNIASLVEDGATLQLGIGSIPDAACHYLSDHKDLGLHSEMWSDGALQLLKNGVINNSRKVFHKGKTTSAFIIGSKEMYDFINDNCSVLNLDAAYVNNADVIIRNPKVTCINSIVEMDLTGQVCADSIGPQVISGVGGQMDFLRAAALSKGGKPILAFTSTTNKGQSRIQCLLHEGAGVVSTRAHVHYVVTEYGIANLFGKTLGERARALINLSHPSHRERLEREWRDQARRCRIRTNDSFSPHY